MVDAYDGYLYVTLVLRAMLRQAGGGGRDRRVVVARRHVRLRHLCLYNHSLLYKLLLDTNLTIIKLDIGSQIHSYTLVTSQIE